jgi:hypothetical protein
MSPLVKTKRQANFTDFKRFGAFKGLVEQKKTLYSTRSCVNWGFLARFTRVLKAHSCQKTPIYTRTRQINYYFVIF